MFATHRPYRPEKVPKKRNQSANPTILPSLIASTPTPVRSSVSRGRDREEHDVTRMRVLDSEHGAVPLLAPGLCGLPYRVKRCIEHLRGQCLLCRPTPPPAALVS